MLRNIWCGGKICQIFCVEIYYNGRYDFIFQFKVVFIFDCKNNLFLAIDKLKEFV